MDTIDDVLAGLDDASTWAIEHEQPDRLLRRHLSQGDGQGRRGDRDRLLRRRRTDGALDVTFAGRYLIGPRRAFEAGDQRATGRGSWPSRRRPRRPIILQHLLVGINAHINLDLGIAAARPRPGRPCPICGATSIASTRSSPSLIAGIEHDLAEVSPWIGLLDRIGGRHDDEIIRFSIEVARTEAWRFATELAPLAPDHWSGPIGARDARVARLARSPATRVWLNAGLLLDPGPREQRRATHHRGAQPSGGPRTARRRGTRAPAAGDDSVRPSLTS